ncbi:hypothetical protein L596_005263 [Steinernema carpocapsae]|uniref:Uncharacterized protein n=1 Tax=Steinernema carpocapsae TaxID=34508 RepID=A0A4U8V2P5_STECR|nr:hypothetical protein L596_005263 [Steinernema carpocapsae]
MLLVKIGAEDIEMYSGVLSGYLISPPATSSFRPISFASVLAEFTTYRAVIRMTVGEKRTASSVAGRGNEFCQVTIAVMSGYLDGRLLGPRSPHAPLLATVRASVVPSLLDVHFVQVKRFP